ncbi:hypothetical protein ABIG06_004721 [Bradyrhizobium sp. USDA 326]|uniref:hypothetical protein n=1 Tax=unclassified Bradyrhizobium TaxID=2631580 RepID=UPI003518F6AF
MATYHVWGRKRTESRVMINIIVDAHGQPAPQIARRIVGPDYVLHGIARLIPHPVPDAMKNRPLSIEELFVAVPALNPRRPDVEGLKPERRGG